jgi:cell wall-associated NlpC family hydrolase
MLKLKPTPPLIRKAIVPIVLAFIVGFPLLSQPLGLMPALSQQPPAATQPAAERATTASSYVYDPHDFDYIDEMFNRGISENLISPDETAPDVLDEEGDPTDTTGTTTETEPAGPAFVAVDYTLYIDANQLNLRAEPSIDSEILTVLKFGDKVQCIGENDEWMKVTIGDQTGYLKTEYTSQDMVFKTVKQTVYVDANKLNLRQDPTTDSAIIMTLSNMTRLTRTGIGDGWSEVKTSSGKVGYVVSKYLTTRGPASSTSGGTIRDGTTYAGDVGRVVDLAYSALGVRYVHAGSSMSGFDCSGLVSWVYRQIGITVPRSTSGYYHIGIGVSYSNIQPGDIICMDTRRSDGITSITHVGIYVGGGMMIHASSSHHKVVLQNLSQYLGWGVKLITIRRMIN